MDCHEKCGACCMVISISSPLPGMPEGKPAGVTCVNLTEDFRCCLHDTDLYPDVCRRFLKETLFCGRSSEEALKILSSLNGDSGNNVEYIVV